MTFLGFRKEGFEVGKILTGCSARVRDVEGRDNAELSLEINDR